MVAMIAGTGTGGFIGDNGLTVNANLNRPYKAVADSTGAIYISDQLNSRVRKVLIDGINTTIVGSAFASCLDLYCDATAALLKTPKGILVTTNGNLYMSRTSLLSNFTGSNVTTTLGDGGDANNAKLNVPTSVVGDSVGSIYIADQLHSRIRKVDATTYIITTVVGNGTIGFDNEAITQARIEAEYSLAYHPNG